MNVWDINNWIPEVFREGLKQPGDYIPEIAGFAILLFFTFILIRKRKLLNFLKTGQVPIIGRR